MTSLQLEAAGLSDVGHVRTNNEDAWGMDRKRGLLVLADGLGGHNSGEVASAMAVQAVLEGCRVEGPQEGETADLAALLVRWIEAANEAIFQKASASPRDAGMGTTIVAACVRGERLTVASVGDSRIYLFRKGELRQLTRDHTWAEDQVQAGRLSREQARSWRLGGALTRAVGIDREVEVDVSEEALNPEDALLLASDGLTSMLPDSQIRAVLEREKAPPSAARELVEAAKIAGGADNVTVIVARLEDRV